MVWFQEEGTMNETRSLSLKSLSAILREYTHILPCSIPRCIHPAQSQYSPGSPLKSDWGIIDIIHTEVLRGTCGHCTFIRHIYNEFIAEKHMHFFSIEILKEGYDGWMNGWMDEWADWLGRWIDEWVERWGGWMDGWMDGWVDWVDDWLTVGMDVLGG